MDNSGYPVGVQNFGIEVQKKIPKVEPSEQIGGFTEISGMDAEIETEQLFEGGSNDRVINLFKRRKHGRLSLKKGIMASNYMLEWLKACDKRDVTIYLKSLSGDTIRTWIFENAYPVKCTGTRLNAQSSNEIAFETFELVYEAQR